MIIICEILLLDSLTASFMSFIEKTKDISSCIVDRLAVAGLNITSIIEQLFPTIKLIYGEKNSDETIIMY